MPSPALKQFCDIVSTVSISNATKLSQTLSDLLSPHSISSDPEDILTTFAFMNWTIAQGVWSNLENTELRRDLQAEFRDALLAKLADKLFGSDEGEKPSPHAALGEAFESYLMRYLLCMQQAGRADSGTARLFALEQIQEECQIWDHVMNDIVPDLWSDEESMSEVESVAMQANSAVTETKPKGFFGWLFGA